MVYVKALGWLFLFGGTQWACQPVNKAVPTNAQTPKYLSPATVVPVSNQNAASCEFLGRIYFFGGFVMGAPTAEVYVYDPATNLWEQKEDMPAAVGTHQAVTFQGRIHVLGGSLGTAHYVYDPNTDTWTTAREMSQARQYFVALALNGKLYVVAGNDTMGGFLNSCEVYDPMTDSWTDIDDYPETLDAPMGAVYNNLLYVCGGSHNGTSVSAALRSYDPLTDTWTDLTSMATGRQQAVMLEVNGKLCMFGGQDGFLARLSSVEIYDIATDTWSAGTAMPTAIINQSGAAVNGVCYLQTGFNGGESNVHYTYVPSVDKWVTQAGWYFSNHAKGGPGNEIPYVLNNAEQQQVAAIAYCLGGF